MVMGNFYFDPTGSSEVVQNFDKLTVPSQPDNLSYIDAIAPDTAIARHAINASTPANLPEINNQKPNDSQFEITPSYNSKIAETLRNQGINTVPLVIARKIIFSLAA